METTFKIFAMKMNLLRSFALAAAVFAAASLNAAPANLPSLVCLECPTPSLSTSPSSSDVRVILGERKIWFVADETPVSCFTARVFDVAGALVLEKNFSSKIGDWSLDLTELPAGKFRLEIGGRTVANFRKG